MSEQNLFYQELERQSEPHLTDYTDAYRNKGMIRQIGNRWVFSIVFTDRAYAEQFADYVCDLARTCYEPKWKNNEVEE